ncbi:MAG: DUF308 domain-containing protein [Bacteroidales bacterium]|nr:DUF308 domain-containing protein [Clostridium sp.]MCM1204421.1 DUF308 domain-containing protein [Bacteroidales bacterium]
MHKIKEATKNFFVCSVLMIICGIVLIAISQKGLGVVSVIFGLVFAGAGIGLLIKDLKEEPEE